MSPHPLRPFFSYYGAKWSLIPRYPSPRHPQIVEPFAGSASYALHHHDRDVLLLDTNPHVVDVWRYLIGADPDRIRALPTLSPGQTIDEVPDLSDAERSLVGFWLNNGSSTPKRTMTRREHTRSQWGEHTKRRIAEQIPRIRHWRAVLADYRSAPLLPATYFVDPPYRGAGQHYPHGSRTLDYAALGEWCRSLPGFVLVCENADADWLPFSPLARLRGSVRGSTEALWTNVPVDRQLDLFEEARP